MSLLLKLPMLRLALASSTLSSYDSHDSYGVHHHRTTDHPTVSLRCYDQFEIHKPGHQIIGLDYLLPVITVVFLGLFAIGIGYVYMAYIAAEDGSQPIMPMWEPPDGEVTPPPPTVEIVDEPPGRQTIRKPEFPRRHARRATIDCRRAVVAPPVRQTILKPEVPEPTVEIVIDEPPVERNEPMHRLSLVAEPPVDHRTPEARSSDFPSVELWEPEVQAP